MDLLFLNRDAARIIGITQRQVLAWTEKGLIVPSREATGAGTKREYDYVNLLELGLIRVLFFMGFGVQAVKKLLKDLRKDNTIRDWSNNFSEYNKEIYESQKRMYQRAIDDPESFSLKALPKDPKGSLKKLEQSGPFKPDKPSGILFYFYGIKIDGVETDDPFSWVIPYEKEEVVFEGNLIKKHISASVGAIIIDLGKIKAEIDKKL